MVRFLEEVGVYGEREEDGGVMVLERWDLGEGMGYGLGKVWQRGGRGVHGLG
ncbi:uncharacterized protein G2W53_044599 [Senna tora]|uniref:Uncharacterized protein n=1 Tax=Senna tora TaxID=362788 RepID=A0A834SCN3_9FABA|nr:uncharacterized protein G2W53_044599 [Senna tora]